MSVSGKYLTATVNGVAVVGLADWEADDGGDELDATVGALQGYTSTDTGPDQLTVTLTILMDTTTGQYVGVRRGTIFENLRLFRRADDTNPAFYLPESIVTKSRQSARVRGRVEVSCTVQNRGAFEANDP